MERRGYLVGWTDCSLIGFIPQRLRRSFQSQNDGGARDGFLLLLLHLASSFLSLHGCMSPHVVRAGKIQSCAALRAPGGMWRMWRMWRCVELKGRGSGPQVRTTALDPQLALARGQNNSASESFASPLPCTPPGQPHAHPRGYTGKTSFHALSLTGS